MVVKTINWYKSQYSSTLFSELELRRPLLFFDLETTGLDVVSSRIVQIALLQVLEDGSSREWETLVNPGVPIPPATTAIHGITDEDVKDAPKFEEIAEALLPYFFNSDLAGYNSTRFDVPMIVEEFARTGIKLDLTDHALLDAHLIFTQKEPRNLVAAYRYYCNAELFNAHSALADTRATAEVLAAQLRKYDDLPSDVKGLSQFCNSGQKSVDLSNRLAYNDKNEIVFNFGKYKGQVVRDVFAQNDGYYGWIMQADFSAQVKEIVTTIYKELHKA
ncbi:MAG: exonuclease domain-containing protein [Bacteroides sp.]